MDEAQTQSSWSDRTGFVCASSSATRLPDGLVCRKFAGMAGGAFDTVVLRSNGLIGAWGSTNYNKLVVPAGLTNAVAVAAGAHFNLALRPNGNSGPAVVLAMASRARK